MDYFQGLEKPFYPYFFICIIPTFSLLFKKFCPFFFIEGHLKAWQ